MRCSPVLAAAIAAFLFLLSVPASAQVPVAVMPFGGAGGSGARRQVQSALEDDGRVGAIDLGTVDGAAERAGAGSSGEDGIADAASELGARVIIQGNVSGRGRRRRVVLTARDETGRQIGRAGGAMRGGGVSRAVRSLLGEALEGLPPEPEEPVEAVPEPIVDEEPAGGIDEEAEVDGEERPLQERSPWLSAQVVLGIRTRDASVTLADTTNREWNARPVYAELGVRAELRPFASSTDLLRGLYGNFFFANSVGLQSTRVSGCTPTDADDCKIDTNFFRVAFAVGFLFPLVDILDLGVEFGAGWDVYNIETNDVLPSAEYVYLRPALRSRLRLVDELVGIDFEMGVRPVVSRGAIGYDQGGDTTGFDVGGGLSGSIPLAGGVGLTYGVEIAWVSYWLGYAEPETPSAMDATTGTDQGVRITFAVGVGLW